MNRRQPMKQFKKMALDLLFPRCCPVCGQIVLPKGNLICPGCMGKLSWVRCPTCLCCGREIPIESEEYCTDCFKRPRSFDVGMALINYNEAASRSMAQIKYNNKREYLDLQRGHVPETGDKASASKAGCADPHSDPS